MLWRALIHKISHLSLLSEPEGYKMEYGAWRWKLLYCRLWDCHMSATLNTVCWLPQAKHRQAQHFGKFKWNLWMHCFIFPVRCTQIQEQFYMDFLTSPGTFMIEEDAIHSKEIVGLSEVHHNPVGIQFCCPYKNNLRCYIHQLHLCTAQTHMQTDTGTYTHLSSMQGEGHVSATECARIWLIP